MTTARAYVASPGQRHDRRDPEAIKNSLGFGESSYKWRNYIGLSVLISRFGLQPVEGVTVLACLWQRLLQNQRGAASRTPSAAIRTR
ncbi:hypothetical protein [Streptomyces sp. NPDC005408]|uniref:hypothetical protein n=1 Tax=Streptomyces sp. NPDC005408 TaxID=3155341 RepID=UPI0033A015C4